ncbi:hypothetical protein [Flavobacterium sp. DG2-3]|uniref:hypothetical protein n=1 Tax=Flavobacterium sp. DG2-3 TaxID=3068317 RepID=UPI0027401877|nr:hypothetical protein [Flavobacterium sp. DG2-3]MDP5199073.1 hypothetical protein [Flavobacterium sp. DG2-3]
MDKRGPIIIIEENIEDRRLFAQIFLELTIGNKILYFDTLQESYEELLSNKVKPFLIFANILQFEEKNKHKNLENHTMTSQKLDCPCLFFSVLFPNCFIIDTYSVPAKSYFISPYSEEKFKQVLYTIIQFWTAKNDQSKEDKERKAKFKLLKNKPI